MTQSRGDGETREYVSWVSGDAEGRPPGAVRRWLETVRDGGWFDMLAALLVLGLIDLVVLLSFAGWQSAKCGGTCGLLTQMHLLRIGTLFLSAVPAVTVLTALVFRRQRVALIAVQLLLFGVLLSNNLSSQHRLESHINGTATCWNSAYSNRDCPWGVRD